MSNRINSKTSPNSINNAEQNIQELLGYDDATLLREFKEAEQELLGQMDEDPELEQKIAAETEAGFDALMAKIREANLKPVSEAEYAETKEEEERKVVFLKPVLRVLFVAAAVLVVLMGMGGGVSARRNSEYVKVKVPSKRNEVIWSDNELSQNFGTLDTAYEKVYEELGISVLKLGHKPKGLIFTEVLFDKGHAIMKFKLGTRNVFLKEAKYPVDELSKGVSSDRQELEEIYNPLLHETFTIEENLIEKDFVEYSTEINIDGVFYYFSGNIEKEDFIKMVEFLTF